MAALDHLASGTDVTPAIWNAVMDVIKNLQDNAITVGGTVGASDLPGTVDGNRTSVTTDSSGNANIFFNVDFVDPPAVVVTGWGSNPNVLVTIATSGSPVTKDAFRVHCHSVANDTNFGNHTLTISWIAVKRN